MKGLDKIQKQTLLLLYADHCKPITSKLHLDSMMKLVNDAMNAEKYLKRLKQ